jgi:hypothetical protein
MRRAPSLAHWPGRTPFFNTCHGNGKDRRDAVRLSIASENRKTEDEEDGTAKAREQPRNRSNKENPGCDAEKESSCLLNADRRRGQVTGQRRSKIRRLPGFGVPAPRVQLSTGLQLSRRQFLAHRPC